MTILRLHYVSCLCLLFLTLWMIWSCSKASKVYFNIIKNNSWQHQKQQVIKLDALYILFQKKFSISRTLLLLFPVLFQMDLTPQIFLHKFKTRRKKFLTFWSKLIFDAFKKNLRKVKCCQERKKIPYFPPPLLFFEIMTNNIKINYLSPILWYYPIKRQLIYNKYKATRN